MIKSLVGTSIILAVLLGLGGFSTYYALSNKTLVTVKGLSEKIVRSDIAEMSINFSNKKFENLEELSKKRLSDKEKVLSFLKDHGITDEEIVNFSMDTSDYTEETKGKSELGAIINTKKSRYFKSSDTFYIKTKQLEKIDILKSDIVKLLSDDVFVKYDYNYKLTNFIDVKLGMMREASANARRNAEVFVEPQGVEIEDVAYLNQGEITIRAEDESEDVSSWQSKKDKSINKKLRLVVRAGFSKKSLW